MGKKKKAKAKVEMKPNFEGKTEDEKANIVKDSVKAYLDEDPRPKVESAEVLDESGEAKPEKDPEPVNKPEEPETAPVEAPAEEPIVEEVPEGMVKIPCECIKCKNQFDLFVPKGLGTPILYYRDCEKCR